MIEWTVRLGLTPYAEALDDMDLRADKIYQGLKPERILLVEHPPLYTAGTSAKQEDVKQPARFPIFQTGRGGEYTYHGPGQRVVYPAINLRPRGRDVRAYVAQLEGWIIAALRTFRIEAFLLEKHVGVWVGSPEKPAKIGAIGVRIRRWVTLHGFSVNVHPDLDHFSGIVPCGLTFPVTSMKALGVDVGLTEFDDALERTCPF